MQSKWFRTCLILVVLFVAANVGIGAGWGAFTDEDYGDHYGYQDIVVNSSVTEAIGGARLNGDYYTCRVEVWIHGGTSGPEVDEASCTSEADALVIDDNGPWCGVPTSVANLWVIGPSGWEEMADHQQVGVFTELCIE